MNKTLFTLLFLAMFALASAGSWWNSDSSSKSDSSDSKSKSKSSSGSKSKSGSDSNSKSSSGSGSKSGSSSKSSSSNGKSSSSSSGNSKKGKDTPSPTPYPTEECVLTGEWLDRDDESGWGDFERSYDFSRWNHYEVCGGDDPLNAICRTVDGHIDFDDYEFDDNNIYYAYCNENGFVCVDKWLSGCVDFEVQFCCPP